MSSINKSNLTLSVSSDQIKTLNRSLNTNKSDLNSDLRPQLVNELNELKQKAHQSFLQVTQMQHLHQQEIDLLREQFSEKEKKQKLLIQQLRQKITDLEKQLKINNKHLMDLSNSSFSIQNIDLINFKDDVSDCCFDESSILQMRQILSVKHSKADDKLQDLKKEILKEIKNISSQKQRIEIEKLFQKLFKLMKDLTCENTVLKQKIQDAHLCFSSLQAQFKNLKIQNQSSQKQNKFLSDNIRKILGDKSVMEKKIHELEKNKKLSEEIIKNLKKSINQNGASPILKSQKDCHKNSQLSLSFKNNDFLFVPCDNKLLTRSQKLTSQQKILTSSQDICKNRPTSIKNFRKNKETLAKIQNNP